MEIKSKKNTLKKFFAIALVSVISLGMTSSIAFAEADEGKIEREFTIDVNAPNTAGDKNNEFTVDVNEPTNNSNKTPNVGGDFIIDVNKPSKNPNNTSNVSEEVIVDVNQSKKDTSTNKKAPGYDPYVPTRPSKARGTLTESVGADNKPYPVRDEIKGSTSNKNSSNKTKEGSQAKDRPKADSREFLTFETANGKVFHLIINRDEEDSNVQLLTEVSEQDLLNMIVANEEANSMGKTKEKPEKEVVKKEEPKKEEPKKEKNSKGSFLILLIIALAAGGAGYYFKVVKPKSGNLDDFEDEEIPDDDFFSESDEEKETTEDTTKDEEYTEEDLL